MIKRKAAATALTAGVLYSLSAGVFAQAPSPHAKTPSSATGSGQDTGMNVQSGMSGNGPGGVGTVASPAATGSTAASSTSTGRSSASKSKKSVKHSKKHNTSSTSASR